MASSSSETQPQHEEVIQFLEENNVKPSWKELIRVEPELWKSLAGILNKLQTTTHSPERKFILRCLSYAECDEIKVVIIGQDPNSEATGLAFSCTSLDIELKPEIATRDKVLSGETIRAGEEIPSTKRSIWLLHEALRQAKLLEDTDIYCCIHERWAKAGILLINRYLTIGKKKIRS